MLLYYLSLLENQEDKTKFELLYHKYSRLMKYIALKRLQDDHLAEEAVQEAFIKVIKSFYKVEDVDSHKTKRFLVVITENVITDILRKEKSYTRVSYEELEPILSITPDMLDGVAVKELMEVIGAMPEIYRSILELRAYHGLSDKQIATVLDVSYATVRKRLERARAMLVAEMASRQKGVPYESV